MILTENASGGWEHPTAGLHQAVCVDVIDLGVQQTKFGEKEQVKLVFQLDEGKADGTPIYMPRTYTASLNIKATLRKDLKSWRGADLSPEERGGFDMEKLVGAQAQVNIEEFEKDGGEKGTSIGAILPPASKQKLKIEQGYKRDKDYKLADEEF